jgi:penicillin-binding protein 1A
MALPIWALFMKKVYSDSSLGISQRDFEKPLKDISIDFDCEEYDRQNSGDVDSYSDDEEF